MPKTVAADTPLCVFGLCSGFCSNKPRLHFVMGYVLGFAAVDAMHLASPHFSSPQVMSLG